MYAFIWTLPLLRLVSAVAHSPVDEKSLEKNAFFEQFAVPDLAQSGWVVSKASKANDAPYNGKWSIQEAHSYPGFEGDNGLVMVSEADYFAISKLLPVPITANKQDLVVQFEVKFQDGISCGGAYLKLLSDLDPDTFSDASRYEVMFGPDICGSQNKVHFLIKQDTTDDSKDSELRTPPMAKSDALSALYTLIVRANGDMEIRINGGVAKAGNLLNTENLMVPPISIPELIPDKSAQKPEDWDDRPLIFDASVAKPENYDELHNSMWISDPNVHKPEGWNEHEPLYIADPAASRPAEWDDEEDGDWRPPMVSNPKCAHGCGKWEAPKVVNPNYKGEWVPPAIVNPNYKGEWKRPYVPNPDFESRDKAGIRPINGIGFDVWSMQSGVMFNNIYVGHSVADAERIGNETFIKKWDLEYALYKKTKPRAKHEPRTPPKSFDDILDEKATLLSMVKAPFVAELETANTLWSLFQVDPVSTMAAHPFRFAGYCFLFVLGFTLIFGIINVFLFLYLSSREEAKEHDRKIREAGKKKVEKKEEELSEEEVIAQLTGKATGARTRDTSSRKIR